MPSLPFTIRLFASSLAAFRAVAVARQARPTALLALQGTFLNRLRLMILLAVVVLLIALAFPFGGTYITELMSRGNLPATGTPGNILLRYGLSYPCRPSEFELIEQIKAIPVVQVLAPMMFADLPAPAFGKWPPAHECWLITFFNIT